MTDPLGDMAIRAEADPFYLGFLLARARRKLGVEDDGLCQHLGITAETLRDLKLCRAPAAKTWDADLGMIAARFGLSLCVLDEMLRKTHEMPTTDGETVAILRARKGWSQAYLACEARIDVAKIVAIERGDRTMSAGVARKLCIALGVTLGVFDDLA